MRAHRAQGGFARRVRKAKDGRRLMDPTRAECGLALKRFWRLHATDEDAARAARARSARRRRWGRQAASAIADLCEDWEAVRASLQEHGASGEACRLLEAFRRRCLTRPDLIGNDVRRAADRFGLAIAETAASALERAFLDHC